MYSRGDYFMQAVQGGLDPRHSRCRPMVHYPVPNPPPSPSPRPRPGPIGPSGGGSGGPTPPPTPHHRRIHKSHYRTNSAIAQRWYTTRKLQLEDWNE